MRRETNELRWTRQIAALLMGMLLVSSLSMGTLSGQGAGSAAIAAEVLPLVQAHAHNDYLHEKPLEDALAHGFCSVEADVFLVRGELLVGHSILELRRARTLTALYLKPLQTRVRANGGRVYRDGPAFTLLVDIKSEGPATYALLAKQLQPYADMISQVVDGRYEQRAIDVIVSGNRAREPIEQSMPRRVGIDGRSGDLESHAAQHLVPLISDNWRTHFRWRGEGPMPQEQRTRLRKFVASAHAKGRRVRFWATPESPQVWKELLDAEVDLIGTDDLAALARFLQAHREGKSSSR